MERQAAFPHPLLRMPRAGDREIRAKWSKTMPITRKKEEKDAEQRFQTGQDCRI